MHSLVVDFMIHHPPILRFSVSPLHDVSEETSVFESFILATLFQLATVTQFYQMWIFFEDNFFASHKYLQIFTNNYKHLQIFTYVYKYLQISTIFTNIYKMYKYLQISTLFAII